ncbi:MAG: hypothetical protein KAI57_00455 [Candidatus Pacebacteria bacterium]|nr:hypothetical protein [Candidatus Paceibacterota bacterium]
MSKGKTILKIICGLVILTLVFFFGLIALTLIDPNLDDNSALNQEKIYEESENQIINSVINFDKLREWNPDDDIHAIGLEILVSKDDVTEENIVKLAESIASNTQKAVVKIYQNRQAWEEEQSRNYTDVYNQDYLAFYVKNLTNSNAYRGFNEIRWMQEKGDLQDLFGTKTKLK